MPYPIKNKLIQIVAAVFIFLFTYTAITKLTGHASFSLTLSKSPLIGSYSGIISILLPATELAIAVLLLFSATRKIGLYGSIVLMILFTAYLIYMIGFIKDLPCSCGGVLQKMSWQQHLWFNIFFTVLAGIGIYLYHRNDRLTRPWRDKLLLQ